MNHNLCFQDWLRSQSGASTHKSGVLARLGGQAADDKSDEDAVTVTSKSARKDIVLTHDRAVDAAAAQRKLLLAAASDTSKGFLQQKTIVEKIITTRLKSLDNGKGASKQLKLTQEKIDNKSISTGDLPATPTE